MKGFLSDNSSGVHPTIMQALNEANLEHNYPYGDDAWTHSLEDKIQQIFGLDAKVIPVINGTGANVLGLSSALDSYHSVIAVETSHINVDECGAFEKLTGAKLVCVPHENGKITIEAISKHLSVIGNFHHNQPKIISISQLTEFGSAYTNQEIKSLADFAHKNNMLLHMDGARIANACVAMDTSFFEMVTKSGVDILSFGGTKNGLMFGELIITFNNELYEKLKFYRKQGMQLASKMRFISAQFLAYLNDNVWLENAKIANERCLLLYRELKSFEEVEFLSSVDGNMIFAKVSPIWLKELKTQHYFYIMDEHEGIIRLVTSFDTTVEEVMALIHSIRIEKSKSDMADY